MEIEAKGNAVAEVVPPAESSVTSSSESGVKSGSDSVAEDKETGCNSSLFFAAAPVLTILAAAIILKKDAEKRL